MQICSIVTDDCKLSWCKQGYYRLWRGKNIKYSHRIKRSCCIHIGLKRKCLILFIAVPILSVGHFNSPFKALLIPNDEYQSIMK